jgi:hypothetical protein
LEGVVAKLDELVTERLQDDPYRHWTHIVPQLAESILQPEVRPQK